MTRKPAKCHTQGLEFEGQPSREDVWGIIFKLAEQLGCLELINMDAYRQYIEGK